MCTPWNLRTMYPLRTSWSWSRFKGTLPTDFTIYFVPSDELLSLHSTDQSSHGPLIGDFYERSVKALDVCNAVQEGIEQIRQWQKLLEIVLCTLGDSKVNNNTNANGSENCFRRSLAPGYWNNLTVPRGNEVTTNGLAIPVYTMDLQSLFTQWVVFVVCNVGVGSCNSMPGSRFAGSFLCAQAVFVGGSNAFATRSDYGGVEEER
ncbi:hypothetical protein F3Y22_tig00111272pilonHSYRG00023 [Hibiscus syriacus]|uniref:Uncharacterized protein n=1 Tax=Hibiscus syriacus TaxID=106335 RepID=A0A6A2YSH5_HIBSY|nr:hypothetical protein F3Y22_tig00111272pilonHSYRG00023 [Hibiscus syriacus]